MITTTGSIVIVDLNKLFVNGALVENVVSISINKSQSVAIRVTAIDCKYKAELQALGIMVKVV